MLDFVALWQKSLFALRPLAARQRRVLTCPLCFATSYASRRKNRDEKVI
jgi:hypothetical protein